MCRYTYLHKRKRLQYIYTWICKTFMRDCYKNKRQNRENLLAPVWLHGPDYLRNMEKGKCTYSMGILDKYNMIHTKNTRV